MGRAVTASRVKFLMQFQEEVQKVERLQWSKAQEELTVLQGAVGGLEEPRSVKPLILPPFSGADPVPKDEASCEQWVWQAKEALKSCTVGAMRIAIVQSVRGEAREFTCLLYTSPSPRDATLSRMPSSA